MTRYTVKVSHSRTSGDYESIVTYNEDEAIDFLTDRTTGERDFQEELETFTLEEDERVITGLS